MKKLILLISSLLLFTNVALANNLSDRETLKETTFDVNEVFTLPGQESATAPTNTFSEGPTESPIVNFFLSMITFATEIIGSIAVILFIVAGFMFMFSQGNEQTVTKAKEVIKYAIIGLAATFLSYVIVIFVQAIFNK